MNKLKITSKSIKLLLYGGSICTVGALGYYGYVKGIQTLKPWPNALTAQGTPRFVDGTHINPTIYNDLVLQNVSVFFRHGARTPLRHIPGVEEVTYDKAVLLGSVPMTEAPCKVQNIHGGDRPETLLEKKVYSKVQFQGGCIAGQLTHVGKLQAYEFGKRLKDKYIDFHHFISETYTPGEISARSTNITRCVLSLQSALAGLFGAQNINKNDPPVITISPETEEILFPNVRHCPVLGLLSKRGKLRLEHCAKAKTATHLIREVIGNSDGEALDMMQWRDHIVARKAHGLDVPEWLDKLETSISEAAVETLKGYVGYHSEDEQFTCMLASGPIFDMIEGNIKRSVLNQNKAPKLHLYACHDSTLVPMLIAIGGYDNVWPPYCADIRFELMKCKSSGKHFVQITYCDKVFIPADSKSPVMSLAKFREVMAPVTLDHQLWMEKCQDMLILEPHTVTEKAKRLLHPEEPNTAVEEAPPGMQ